ncbi:ABC transporter substrate-binding protein [Frankia sp. Cpl3]|nr:ABC transporter substrate-binding protein [Frankia sp. Cpl3]
MRTGSCVRRLGVAAAILVAAGAGCSSGGGEKAVVVDCDTPGVSADQVTLGFVYSDSGVGSAAQSSARSGMQARLGLANEQGGIHGRRIVYQWRDDANSLLQNAHVTEELVRRESVFGLVTATISLGDAMRRLEEQGVPVVGLAGEAGWAQHPNMFSYTYGESPETVGRYIQAAGGTTVAILTTGSAPATMEGAARYSGALQSVGLTVGSPIPYSAAGDSPTRVAQQLAEMGADSLVALSSPDDLAAILESVHTAGLNIVASVSYVGYDRGILAARGAQLAGVSVPVGFRPFEAGGAAMDRYRNAMARFAPETGQPEQQYAMFSYIYTDMFLRGLDLAGSCPTRQGFIDALRGVTAYDADGLIAPVSLRDNVGKLSTCNAFVQINPAGNAFDIVKESLCVDGTGS